MEYKAHLSIWTLHSTDHCDASIEVFFQADDFGAAINKAWELLGDYAWRGTTVTAYRKYNISVTRLSDGLTVD